MGCDSNKPKIMKKLEKMETQISTQIVANKKMENKINVLKTQIKDLTEANLVGLDNTGANCYLNVILQSLSNTTKLTKYFFKNFQNNKNNNNNDKIICNEYYNVLKNLWDRKNDKQSFAANSFKQALINENPGINNYGLKDLLIYLLEGFHRELNEISGNNNFNMNNTKLNPQDNLDEQRMLNFFINNFRAIFHSKISDLFYGTMKLKIKCHVCNHTMYNFQLFNLIDFPLHQVNQYCINQRLKNGYYIDNLNRNNSQNFIINLYDCFKYNENKELMNGNNQNFCCICNNNCDAFCSKKIYTLPNYLIINLNRGQGNVNQYKVNFPKKLNLLNFVEYQEVNTYFELYSVISSSIYGNILAYCQNNIDKKWYKYNDSIVEPCNQKDEYLNCIPNLLFYQAL